MSSGSPGTGTPSSPSGSPLPSYLAHHIDIGFDADDVSALISAIDSSQGHASQQQLSLPRLPAEILFHILEFVPIEHVLEWRLVCRGFRDCIDGPVIYSCIRRAELIGCFGSLAEFLELGLDETMYESVALVRCKFQELGSRTDAKDPRTANARWAQARATFNIDETWRQEYLKICEQLSPEDQDFWDDLFFELGHPWTNSNAQAYGILKWCMRLDDAVLDLEFPAEALRNKIHLGDAWGNEVVIEKWRDVLLRFIKTTTLLEKRMNQVSDES